MAAARWVCRACGIVYDEAKGDPDSGIAPGTRFEDIPEDWRCPVCGVGKADFMPMPEAPVRTAAPCAAPRGRGIVVVGAGTAGWAFARAVRERDPDVPVTLVTACDGDVYHKPLLSVSVAKGKRREDLVQAGGAAKARELGVRLVCRAVALRIDAVRRRLVTTRGTIAYRDLVVATGSRPRRLPLEGDAAGEVIAVNDLEGYARLASVAKRGRRVAILGAGLVGCELAANLAEAGVGVLLVDCAAGPLAGQVAPEAAAALASRLAALGIATRWSSRARTLRREGAGLSLGFDDGTEERVDAVVGATGLEPAARLVAKAGLADASGIPVETGSLRTSDPHVYAIGECASAGGVRYGYIEPIVAQAEACAAILTGGEAAFEPEPPLVRLKMPALPMAWGRVAGAASPLAWRTAGGVPGEACYEAGEHGKLEAFVLTGALADRAGEWQARLAR